MSCNCCRVASSIVSFFCRSCGKPNCRNGCWWALRLPLFVNANFFYTLIVPFQVQHAIMTLLVIVTAILVAQASPEKMSGAGEARFVGVLVVIAIVATFTLGNAPVILIAGATTAVALRWPLAGRHSYNLSHFAHGNCPCDDDRSR